MSHYILLKIHNKTGLKYLCKHVTNKEKTCYSYLGSGTRWGNHLKKHGKDISTKILKKCFSLQEAKKIGLYYSKKFNIVKSKKFANLVPEEGQGGAEVAKLIKNHNNRFGFERKPNRYFGKDNFAKKPEIRKKISEALKGRKFTKEWREKISKSCQGRVPWNKGKRNPYAKTNHLNIRVMCTRCKKIGPKGAMSRWHFNNCKIV